MSGEQVTSAAGAVPRVHAQEVLLVIAPSWVGDLVMATPALRATREAFPSRRIVALARPGVEELLAASGCVDEVVIDDLRGFIGPWRAGRAARHAGVHAGVHTGVHAGVHTGVHAGGAHAPIETCLLLPNSFRSALAARFSGSPTRIGYRTDGRSWLLTRALAPPGGRGRPRHPISMVDWYAELVEKAFDLRIEDRTPRLTPTAAQESAAERLTADVPGAFAVLNPGANRTDKRWPANRFAQLGQRLREGGLTVLVTGGPRESELTRDVAHGAGGIDLVSRGVTLGALLALLRRATLLVTNDTGPRHLAAAVGCPVVALFGPTDWRWTALEGVRERRLVAEPFLPAETMADRHANACRMERIEVADVLAACEALERR